MLRVVGWTGSCRCDDDGPSWVDVSSQSGGVRFSGNYPNSNPAEIDPVSKEHHKRRLDFQYMMLNVIGMMRSRY
jgi:hypothetical protein